MSTSWVGGILATHCFLTASKFVYGRFEAGESDYSLIGLRLSTWCWGHRPCYEADEEAGKQGESLKGLLGFLGSLVPGGTRREEVTLHRNMGAKR